MTDRVDVGGDAMAARTMSERDSEADPGRRSVLRDVGILQLIRVYRIGQGIRSEVARLFLSEDEVKDHDVGDRTRPLDDTDAEVRTAALFAILHFGLLIVSLPSS